MDNALPTRQRLLLLALPLTASITAPTQLVDATSSPGQEGLGWRTFWIDGSGPPRSGR